MTGVRIFCSYVNRTVLVTIDATEILVGRADPERNTVPDLDLSFDTQVSREHARIWMDDDQWWIEDRGSANGTFVDDRRITRKVVLEPGTIVRLGETQLRLLGDDVPGPLRARAAVTCLDVANYADVNAGEPVVSRITVHNSGAHALEQVPMRLSLSAYGEFLVPSIAYVPPGAHETLVLGARSLLISDQWRTLPEPVETALECYIGDDQPIEVDGPRILVLPPSAWFGAKPTAAVAGFVVPGSMEVETIVTRAHTHLAHLLEGGQSFADALESDGEAVDRTVEAFLLCIREHYHLEYTQDPRSYAADWQRIRFHHEVIRQKGGTCIDLAVLLAACLENVHRDPLIIIVDMGDGADGTLVLHSVVGCWRVAAPEPRPALLTQEEIRGFAASGQILLFDPKGLARSPREADLSLFEAWQLEGQANVRQYAVRYAVDVVAARRAGVAPMAFGHGAGFEREAWLAQFHARREAGFLRSTAITARHLLLGMLVERDGVLRKALATRTSSADRIIEIARASLPIAERPRRWLPESGDWLKVLDAAAAVARDAGSPWIREVDLALALLETNSQVQKVLVTAGVDPKACAAEVRAQRAIGPVASEWLSETTTE